MHRATHAQNKTQERAGCARFVSLLLDGAVLVLVHPYRGRNPEAKNIAYYAGVRTIEYLQVLLG